MSSLTKWTERLILPTLIIIFSIVYFVSKSGNKTDIKKSIETKSNSDATVKYPDSIPKELQKFNTKNIFGVKNTLAYIEYVINHGSDWLGYKGGTMEGGYISAKDTQMVACYVLELSGRRCPHSYPQKAQMYYSSVCAGCHGNDGRGLHGNYPDLTKKHLNGLRRIYESR